jgi:hypothetical protein
MDEQWESHCRFAILIEDYGVEQLRDVSSADPYDIVRTYYANWVDIRWEGG